MPSEQDLLQRAKGHLVALRELIESASKTLDDPEIEVKVRQLKAIQNTIQRMGKGNLPIPDDLRHLRMNLTAETAKRDDAASLLSSICEEVMPLLSLLGLKATRRSSPRSSPGSRLPPGQLTPHSVLRQAIIKALEQMGKLDKALSMFQKALEKNPKSKKLKKAINRIELKKEHGKGGEKADRPRSERHQRSSKRRTPR